MPRSILTIELAQIIGQVIAIIDLNIPKRSGLELVEALRAVAAYDHVPVIVLTSSFADRDREKALAYRIDKFLIKPPDLTGYIRLGLEIRALLLGEASCQEAH